MVKLVQKMKTAEELQTVTILLSNWSILDEDGSNTERRLIIEHYRLYSVFVSVYGPGMFRQIHSVYVLSIFLLRFCLHSVYMFGPYSGYVLSDSFWLCSVLGHAYTLQLCPSPFYVPVYLSSELAP